MRFFRYDVPSVNIEGWATIVMCSDGYFSTVSDYGNYSFRWTHFGSRDFREFFLGLNDGYIISKLNPTKQFDPGRTRECIKDHIIESRKSGEWTKEKAREEWDLIAWYDNLHSWDDAERWTGQTSISDAWELLRERDDPQVSAFCKHTLPRVRELIRKELQTERESAVTEERPNG